MPIDDVKGDNFGAGLPKAMFDELVGLITGGGAKGTPAEQIAILLALAKEENAGLHPGQGKTSILEATLKFIVLQAAMKALVDATNAAEATAAINKLVPAIQEIGKLWVAGPVPEAFLGSD